MLLKKIFSILVILLYLSLVCVEKIHAQSSESAKGPVMKLTIITQSMSDNENVVIKSSGQNRTVGTTYTADGRQLLQDNKKILWCDTIGRVVEEVNYVGLNMPRGFLYQYVTKQTAMAYEYNEKGLVKGSFKQLVYNANGNLELIKRYKDGVYQSGDSIIYDSKGRKIMQFRMNSKSNEWALSKTFEYDSLGRESKVWNGGATYTVEYHPNGSYTEHHIDTKGKKWDRKIIVNKKGQIIKIKEPKEQITFSKFDTYGNWLQRESIQKTSSKLGNILTTIKREIEYYE